jgi:predicted ATP-grasp superfamily ATP-dependent carboligase
MSVLIISRNRQALSPWYHVLLPEPDVVEMLVDKPSFYTYAQQEGLPIPKTFLLRDRADIEAAIESLTYPCILKPAKKTTLWEQHAAGSVYKVSSSEELLDLYERASDWTELLVAQEVVEGGEDSLFAVNCYFSADSKPVATFVSRKLRQWPVETGNGCLREECRNDTALGETLRLFEKVGYRGLGYVEMKRDERTGEHFFIEANIGRPTGGSAIAEAGGVELLYAMYCDVIGWTLPANLEQTYRGVKWLFLAEDLQSAYHYWRRGELTLPAWWRSLRGRKAYAVLSWRDPGPSLGQFGIAIKGAVAYIAQRFGRGLEAGQPETYQRKEEQQHGTI